jgi:hypothetical protein
LFMLLSVVPQRTASCGYQIATGKGLCRCHMLRSATSTHGRRRYSARRLQRCGKGWSCRKRFSALGRVQPCKVRKLNATATVETLSR